MAVAKMKKATLVGLRSLYDEVLQSIQRLGVLEVIDLREEAGPDRLAEGSNEETLEWIDHIESYINRYDPVSKSLIETFTGSRLPVGGEDQAAAASLDLEKLYETVRSRESRLAEIDVELARIESTREQFVPWSLLSFVPEAAVESSDVRTKLALVPASQMSKLAGIFEPLPAGLDVVAENGKTMSVVVTYLDGAAVDAALAEVGAKTVTLPELQHSVAGELAALDAQEHALAAEKEALNQQGLETSALRTALTIRREWAEAGRKLGEAQGRLAATNSVFVLLGWVRERDQEKLVKGMGPFGNAVSLELSDPGPEDNPPISLQNGPFVKPFEAVTTIFGLPHYGEPDPTPLLAPFFLVFFGFAFGDALYGVLLILFSLWLIKRYHLEGSGKSFMTLMIYLGVSTIVMGAILGGWFGDLFRYFPPWLGFLERFRQSLMLVDPISAPLTVFVITLVFGLIQVWTGIFIKFRNRVRNGEFWASFWLEGGWLLFFSGGAVAVVQAAGYMTSLPKIVGLAWALGGAAVIVLGAAMRTSNWFMKIPAGLYGFYPVVGYLADMLSYSRLLALGLAGGVVATVMNQLASMVNFAPVIGPILMAVIVLGGQIFNFMINILGAFIHSARLQFIEYFSKFFEGGGRPFRPLSIEHAHTFAKE